MGREQKIYFRSRSIFRAGKRSTCGKSKRKRAKKRICRVRRKEVEQMFEVSRYLTYELCDVGLNISPHIVFVGSWWSDSISKFLIGSL